jgi:hypothetical protein
MSSPACNPMASYPFRMSSREIARAALVVPAIAGALWIHKRRHTGAKRGVITSSSRHHATSSSRHRAIMPNAYFACWPCTSTSTQVKLKYPTSVF